MAQIITDPMTGTSAALTDLKSVYSMAYKYVDSVINGTDIKTEFPEMNRTISEWGAIVESARIPATVSDSVNPDTTSKCAPAYVTPKVLYFQDWTEKVYPAEVRRIDATKVLTGEMTFEAFVAKLINANLEGYRDETNQSVKLAMLNNSSDASAETAYSAIYLKTADGSVLTDEHSVLGDAGQYEVLQTPTYADVFEEVINIAKDMRHANSTYSDGFRASAGDGDIFIYAPERFMTKARVRYLSRLQQLTESLPDITIRESDALDFTATDTTHHNVILVCDRRFISHVERWRESTHFTDNCRKSERYDLHIEDGTFINTLYKAYAIVFPDPSDVQIPVLVTNAESQAVPVSGELL